MEKLLNKRILVTGGTGLVGSHLVNALVRQGAQVVVPFRSIDPRSFFATERLADQTMLVHADLKDHMRVTDIVTKYEIEVIYHLAAQPIVTTAYTNPHETVATNVMGTLHILEAARQFPGIEMTFVASSDKAYGKSSRAYKETDPLRGDHPYEASKSAADLISLAYAKTYDVPVVVTRFGNIYGPGDLNFSRIIPGIMHSVLTGEKLVLRSDGSHRRDYVYVGDVVSAYLFLYAKRNKAVGQAYNISSDTGFTVTTLIKKIESILSQNVSYTIADTAQNEIPHQRLDTKKIRALGWKSQSTFATSIQETYAWYTAMLS